MNTTKRLAGTNSSEAGFFRRNPQLTSGNPLKRHVVEVEDNSTNQVLIASGWDK
jgi:hypothetical protein